MYVLKKNSDTINFEENLYRDDDDEFEWKYNDSYDYLKNEEIKPYDKITLISNNVRIFKFLDANVKGDIEYSHANFIVRSTIGHWYPVDHSGDVFHLHYSVNVLGWMEDPFAKSKLQYNEVFRSNNIQLMNLCYQLGKSWLHSYIQLPHAQSYIKNTSPQFQESDFMNFSPTMKTHHLPDSGGSYISRYRSISSHIKLTVFLDESIEYFSIYFTTILLDFMAFSSHIINKTYHLDSLIHSVEQARRKFKREFKKCASLYKQFKHTVLFVNIIDKVFIMPNIEHIIYPSISSILDNNIKIPSTINSSGDYEKYFTFKNRKYSVEAEYIENARPPTHKSYKTLDLVPRSPRDDFYIRYGNVSRIHQFLSKYPDRIMTWTEDNTRSNRIANNNNKPTLASSTMSSYSDSSPNFKTAKASSESDSDSSDFPPPTVPTSLSTSSSSLPIPNMDVALLAQERRNITKYSTPTKKPRMNLHMTVNARSSLQILASPE